MAPTTSASSGQSEVDSDLEDLSYSTALPSLALEFRDFISFNHKEIKAIADGKREVGCERRIMIRMFKQFCEDQALTFKT